mgnify:CR=1 FL=1
MMSLIKTHGPGISTAILSLAMLAGMSACQSEQNSPATTNALPQDQAQAAETSPTCPAQWLEQP